MRITGVLLPFFLFLSWSCGQPALNSAGQPIADSSIQKGKALASVYCQSCHQLPDPSLLNKRSWEKGVLPAMGPRLGIFQFGMDRYPSDVRDPDVGRKFYPSRPLLTDWQWKELIDYYSGMAPVAMALPPEHEPIDTNLSLFTAVAPLSSRPAPVTCFVRVDTGGARRQVLAGSLAPSALFSYDASLHQTDSAAIQGGIVDMELRADSGIACNIGNINPNNGRLGSAHRVRYGPGGKLRIDSVAFLRGLARPVQVTAVDLNGDRLTDYLVCEFGHQRGALTWMENTGTGYIRHVLRAEPGAIKAYIRDVNHDGLPDIWVLFAQGDEGIFLYINKGHGEFEERRVLRFPPVYGSSYFELADFNKDGFPDIVYTCGDNADYSPVAKPYHGVYIYLNDGQGRFHEAFFYPINGCYKAMARDFDGDGDLDLVCIAAFADFGHHPEEGFVYLENRGGMTFKPYSLPVTQAGRWLTMDVGDIDGDGRVDVVLGNFSVGPSLSRPEKDWKKGPPILILMNKSALKLNSH